MEVFDASRLHLFRSPFGNDKAAMPILSAVDGHNSLAVIGVEEQVRIVCTFGQPHLERIHGSANDQVSPDFQWPVGALRANSDDPAILFDDPGDLGLHSQVKRGIPAPLFAEEIQKVPLWHEGHKAVLRSEIRHTTEKGRLPADDGADLTDFLMRE